MTRLLVATRNPGKVREIHEMLAGLDGYEVVGLADLALPESPEEDAVEGAAELSERIERPEGVGVTVTGIPQLYHEFNEKIEQALDDAENRNVSIGVDRRLWAQDLAGSRAHCRMLAARKIITEADAEAILGGPGSQASPEALEQVRRDYGLDQPLLVQYATAMLRLGFDEGDALVDHLGDRGEERLVDVHEAASAGSASRTAQVAN